VSRSGEAFDSAIDNLARERGKALTGYAYLLTGDLGAAEDLVHEGFIKVLTRRGRIGVPALEGYIRRAIVTTYVDGYRRRQRWEAVRHLLVRSERAEAREPAVDQRIDVERTLRHLPPQQRTCVVLRYYDDLTVAEIAGQMHLAEGTVKRYLNLAVHRMEALLGPVTDTTTEVAVVEARRDR
jgi:RNA polymerase sigma factor (sigma-70 family)